MQVAFSISCHVMNEDKLVACRFSMLILLDFVCVILEGLKTNISLDTIIMET